MRTPKLQQPAWIWTWRECADGQTNEEWPLSQLSAKSWLCQERGNQECWTYFFGNTKKASEVDEIFEIHSVTVDKKINCAKHICYPKAAIAGQNVGDLRNIASKQTSKGEMQCIRPGAIIGDGDRKRGVHGKPSKKTNVLFLAKIAPPSTS